MNKKCMKIPLLLLAVTVVLFSGCEQIQALRNRIGNQGGTGGPGAGGPPPAPIFAVNTTTAVQGQIQDYLPLSGDIVASSSVDAYSDAAGRVTRIFVSLGSYVRRDDPIAEIDPSRPGMTYIPSIAKAPVSGTIVSLPAQVGMTVSQAVPLARIAGGSGLELRVYVAERFISKMAVGLPCEVTLDAYPGEIFRGSVREVSPVVDPTSRTLEVRINVDNPQSKLKTGMFAKVRIITERKNNIVKVPATAMVTRFGDTYIFTIEQDSENPALTLARRNLVTPGILIDGVLEIQAGLTPNAEIILRGQTMLEDGARVNIVDRIPPLSAN